MQNNLVLPSYLAKKIQGTSKNYSVLPLYSFVDLTKKRKLFIKEHSYLVHICQSFIHLLSSQKNRFQSSILILYICKINSDWKATLNIIYRFFT